METTGFGGEELLAILSDIIRAKAVFGKPQGK